MPLGNGYWLNRRTGRLLKIDDHAIDAAANPERFGLTDVQMVQAVMGPFKNREYTTSKHHVVIKNEEDREFVIIRVAQAGFIRIRHWRDKLGWQFAGDPLDALNRLRKYAPKNGVGPATLVTFTDFGLGLSVTELFSRFDGRGLTCTPLQDLLETWIGRYEINKPAQKWGY